MSKKRKGKKVIAKTLGTFGNWTVKGGEVKRSTPGKVKKTNLFKLVGEKIPFEAIDAVEKYARNVLGSSPEGVYMAIDSMGCPRYSGRGDVFPRLKAHKRDYPIELDFFSFYIVENKNHQREIETLLIRSTSFLAVLNERKVRASISPGSVLDYEVGTKFVDRQEKKGKKSS